VHTAAAGAGTPDPGFADLAQSAPLAQCVLERAQLALSFGGACELRLNELGAFLTEPLQLEREAADIA